MTGQDLLQDIYDVDRDYREAIEQFRREGAEAAKADRDYRRAKALKFAELKAQGCPATTMEAKAFECDSVLDPHHARNYYESQKNATLELIQYYKRRLDRNKMLLEKEL